VSFEKKTKRLEIRISDALKEKLEKAAKRENTKEAKVVGTLLKKNLTSQNSGAIILVMVPKSCTGGAK